VLGGALTSRRRLDLFRELHGEVEKPWGRPQTQISPEIGLSWQVVEDRTKVE
jgi:hypothetical protein